MAELGEEVATEYDVQTRSHPVSLGVHGPWSDWSSVYRPGGALYARRQDAKARRTREGGETSRWVVESRIVERRVTRGRWCYSPDPD